MLAKYALLESIKINKVMEMQPVDRVFQLVVLADFTCLDVGVSLKVVANHV